MRKTFVSAALCALLAAGTVGCGKKNENTESTAATQTRSVDLAKRKQDLQALVASWSAYGVDINQTSDDHYLLRIKEPQKAGTLLLEALNLNGLDDEAQRELYRAIDGARFAVDTDVKAFAEAKPDSIFVAYLGKGDERSDIKSFLEGKNLGAYLTFDTANQLKKVRIKPIDHTFKDGNDTIQVRYDRAEMDIDTFGLDPNEPKRFTMHTGQMQLLTTEEHNATVTFHISDGTCRTDMKNAYLGTVACRFPSLHIEGNHPFLSKRFDMTIRDIALNSDTKADRGSVTSKGTFGIGDIEASFNDRDGNTSVTLQTLHVASSVYDMNESAVKALSALQSKPPKDEARYIRETMQLVGEIVKRMRFDVDVKLDDLQIKSPKGSVELKAYVARGDGELNDTITYKETDRFGMIAVLDANGKPIFQTQNFTFGYGVVKLSNLLPTLMDTIAEAAVADTNRTVGMPPQLEQKLKQAGVDLIQKGFEVYLDPIRWDTLSVDAQDKKVAMDALDFNIHATLAPNNVPVDFNNPLTGMMLLNSFSANGKLVLKQKDLQTLAKILPPQAGMMLMMFAKQQGDKVVYIIEFKNGALTINGQPLM